MMPSTSRCGLVLRGPARAAARRTWPSPTAAVTAAGSPPARTSLLVERELAGEHREARCAGRAPGPSRPRPGTRAGCRPRARRACRRAPAAHPVASSTVDTVTVLRSRPPATEANGWASAAVDGVKPTVLPELAADQLEDEDERDDHARPCTTVVMRNALEREPGADLAAGDQPDRAESRRRSRWLAHAGGLLADDVRGTARSTTAGGGRTSAPVRSPARRAARPGRPCRRSSSTTVRPPSLDTTRTPGRPSAQPPAAPAAPRPPAAGRRPARRSSTVPTATICPLRTMPTRSQSRSTRSSWWLEKSDRDARGRPSRAAPGSSRRPRPGRGRRTARPAPGSCGSCTSEAASWTRCWLPRLSFCTSSSRRCGDAEPLGPALHRRAWPPLGDIPCSRAR